ncbi:hypothetical protein PIB30_061471 [Stylosanthes scabra]|uniref:ACT domain-containing protein ACR n=1 Tax=Stylosanthes scabra TaxID=79078 RepID=A0ABU6WKP6_9FABA|nr:hypothetical protein [Stylosanthes scabra]
MLRLRKLPSPSLKSAWKFIGLQVDSVNKLGILLEVVQILTDLNLIITKAYISSGGEWFMDGHQAAQLANMEFLHKERQHIIELFAKTPISGGGTVISSKFIIFFASFFCFLPFFCFVFLLSSLMNSFITPSTIWPQN